MERRGGGDGAGYGFEFQNPIGSIVYRSLRNGSPIIVWSHCGDHVADSIYPDPAHHREAGRGRCFIGRVAEYKPCGLTGRSAQLGRVEYPRSPRYADPLAVRRSLADDNRARASRHICFDYGNERTLVVCVSARGKACLDELVLKPVACLGIVARLPRMKAPRSGLLRSFGKQVEHAKAVSVAAMDQLGKRSVITILHCWQAH